MKLNNKKVAILSTHGFEESELTSPKAALEAAGATVHVIAPEAGNIKAWKDGNWSIEVAVDATLNDSNPNDYDALVLPGGVLNPDKLRVEENAISWAKAFLSAGKPMGAICHGPQLLIETGMLHNKNMTSVKQLKTDLINAGVQWEDKEVIVDNGLVTSRTPDDLPAFNDKLIEEIAEGTHDSI